MYVDDIRNGRLNRKFGSQVGKAVKRDATTNDEEIINAYTDLLLILTTSSG